MQDRGGTAGVKANGSEGVEFTLEELAAMLKRLQGVVSEDDFERWRAVVATMVRLQECSVSDKLSLRRFAAMVSGVKTEKTRNVLPKSPSKDGAEEPKAESKKRKKKTKGHGRTGADGFSGAERIKIAHGSKTEGDSCPDCSGTLRAVKKPRRVLRLFGSPAITAKVWELEELRCNACMTTYTAEAPDEAKGPKYDPTATSTLAVLKYWGGVPWNRLEDLQAAVGVPLSASTQWDLMWALYENCGEHVFDALITQAARTALFFIDDTTARLLKQKRPEELARTGTFTSGVIAQEDHLLISLFLTGWRHAGENLERILARRPSELPKPLQMGDAASRNIPKRHATVVGSCMSHGRRRYVELAPDFPDHCRYLLKRIGFVYKIDARAKRDNLSPQDRLILHQAKSAPVMAKLHRWLLRLKMRKIASPSSAFGKAIQYMLNHWQKLTLFLREPGAPLDSNIVERALKVPIRHRRSSLFYRTEKGAKVGDCMMSIIHTCRLNAVNPIEYLSALQRNLEAVHADVAAWMPWNFRRALEQLDTAA